MFYARKRQQKSPLGSLDLEHGVGERGRTIKSLAVAVEGSQMTQQFIELSGRTVSQRRQPIFDLLRSGTVVVYRDLPEVHRLGETIHGRAVELCGPDCAQAIAEFTCTSELFDLRTFSAIYRTFRDLRDGRYVSCLFSDFIEGLDLPRPVLVDAGYCRMVVPGLIGQASRHPDLVDASEFAPRDPAEPERMVHGRMLGGNAHRDIDVRHYHFQVNFWFPLHDLDEKRTLLLYPDAYRSDVLEYGELANRSDPNSWGFGKVLQIPLKFGDMLMFHSQMLHASPTQAPDQNRFTVEMRVASGCIDDNSQIYRRMFWGLRNFLPNGSAEGALLRAQQLAEPSATTFDLTRALAAKTAHAVINSLFRTAHTSLNAGYVRRSDSVLDDAFILDWKDLSRILRRLEELPCDEDLLLLVARLCLRQGYRSDGIALLRTICNRTVSYFWAFEVGYFAVANKERQLAETAFDKAGRLAANSEIKLDQYAPDMPSPRTSTLLQLLPLTAVQISLRFCSRITSGDDDVESFDHRHYWLPPALLTSYRGYNIVQCGSDLVAVDQALGDVQLYRETLGEREIGWIVLRARDINELKPKIRAGARRRWLRGLFRRAFLLPIDLIWRLISRNSRPAET